MANDWITALKAWNAKSKKGTWCVPRKGTKEYDEVRSMMGGGAGGVPVSAMKKVYEEAKERRKSPQGVPLSAMSKMYKEVKERRKSANIEKGKTMLKKYKESKAEKAM